MYKSLGRNLLILTGVQTSGLHVCKHTSPFRYCGRRLVWNSSGSTVSSSNNARHRARPSIPPPSSWNTLTISATAPGQASGIVLRAREARATHSRVSTILEPEEKHAIWENNWLFRDSYWSVGISDQYLEILVWSALAPKYWISGTCVRKEDGFNLKLYCQCLRGFLGVYLIWVQ